MKRIPIPPNQLAFPVIRTLGDQWMLLTAGENQPGKFNMMTVSWGGFGVMWNKPIAMVVVRPSRHTYRFMEEFRTFTLTAFPPAQHEALELCGSKSGRNTDKVKATGLTPIASTSVDAPGFDEAELILECRTLYFDDFKPAGFLSPDIEPNYGGKNYHRLYFGEILAIHGIPRYAATTP